MGLGSGPLAFSFSLSREAVAGAHVDVEDLVVSLYLDFGDIARGQGDAGIIKSEVETAKALEGPSNGIRTVLLVRDVGLHEQTLPAGLLDERGRFLAFHFAPAADDDIGAVPSEGNGGDATDPGRPERDC